MIGHNYKYQKSTRGKLLYTKDTKQAIIYKESVLFVGVELSEHAKNPQLYVLSKADHEHDEDILSTVSVRM